MKLAKSRPPDPYVQAATELGEQQNNLEIGTEIMTPFRIFFEDGCAVTATWRSTITDTEQVNGRNKLTGGTS
jgi:hypothetical protein